VVSKKKSIAAVGGVLAALALTACAPKGATDSAGGYSSGDQPALTNATSDPSAAASPSAEPSQNNVKAENGSDTTELKAVNIPKMGKAVTDQDGWVLYRFDKDTVNPSKTNCVDKCAKVWPPAVTDGNPQLNGVDASLVGTVTRADGSTQITLGGWPLYRYVGDTKAGQWKGQNVGAVWFVVAPDGKKNLSCLPTPPPKAAEPPAENASNDNSGSGGY
jgi:predicted lipoprotein with Yx(FWY)xxD motif